MSIGRSGGRRRSCRKPSTTPYREARSSSSPAATTSRKATPSNGSRSSRRSIDGMVAVGAIGRDRRRAFYSNTGPYIELAAPGGNTRVGGTGGGILQQTYRLRFRRHVSSEPAQYRAPRFDVFTYEFLQGTSMAAPHVVGLRGAPDPAGHHEPGGHRGGDEAICHRSRRPGTRQRVRDTD